MARLCHCVLPHALWHAAVRCRSGTSYGTSSDAFSDTLFVRVVRVGVIIYDIYTGLHQGLPSLCSSLSLHRIRLSLLQGLINRST